MTVSCLLAYYIYRILELLTWFSTYFVSNLSLLHFLMFNLYFTINSLVLLYLRQQILHRENKMAELISVDSVDIERILESIDSDNVHTCSVCDSEYKEAFSGCEKCGNF